MWSPGGEPGTPPEAVEASGIHLIKGICSREGYNYSYGENYNLSTDFVLSQGGSVGKHFHDCGLDIECLVASPYLNHHQMRYTDHRLCESNECGKDLRQNCPLRQHKRTETYAESGKSFSHFTIHSKTNAVKKPYECFQRGSV